MLAILLFASITLQLFNPFLLRRFIDLAAGTTLLAGGGVTRCTMVNFMAFGLGTWS